MRELTAAVVNFVRSVHDLQEMTCYDCHGNHDIGNPPADFKLEAMRGDCHEKMDKEFPNLISMVRQNDRLWEAMGTVRRKRIAEEAPIPEAFEDDVAKLRNETMLLVHTSKEIATGKAKDVNQRAEALRTSMVKWLQSKP